MSQQIDVDDDNNIGEPRNCEPLIWRFWGQNLSECNELFWPKELDRWKGYGNDAVISFANHIKATLAATGYDSTEVLNKWQMLRNYVKVWFRTWDCPNMCTLTEIFIVISGSNSSFKYVFT